METVVVVEEECFEAVSDGWLLQIPVAVLTGTTWLPFFSDDFVDLHQHTW